MLVKILNIFQLSIFFIKNIFQKTFQYWKYLLISVGVFLSILLVIDYLISKYVEADIYFSIDDLPPKNAAVILGTSKYTQNHKINLFYQYRIDAAYELYIQQKYQYLLLSGDNKTIYYNEPMQMYKDLSKKGVLHDQLFFDYAGFSTLDSIIRANKVFGLDDFIIITQQFHCERALLIAKHHNIKAICYAAKDPSSLYKLKVRVREIFARLKVVIDLYIIKRSPYFLGSPEPLPIKNI